MLIQTNISINKLLGFTAIWVSMMLAVGCGQAPNVDQLSGPKLQLSINGQEVANAHLIDLETYFNAPSDSASLGGPSYISIANRGEQAQRILFFTGDAQDVRISGLASDRRLGVFVPYDTMKGQAWPSFFRRQFGYAGLTAIDIEAAEQIDLKLSANKHIPIEPVRNFQLMSPAYQRHFAMPAYSHFANGLFQGMIWVLIIYHLLLYFSLWEKSYLYYCLYMFSISALTLGDVGYWQKDLFGNNPILGWHLYQAFQYIAGILTLIFMRSFVELDRLNPRFDKKLLWFIKANLGIFVLIGLIYILTASGIVIELAKLLVIPYAAFGLWVCYMLFKSGDKVARYFAFAGCILAVSIGLNAAFELFTPETFPGTDFRRYYWIQAIVILHLLTFALGMGYRRRQRDLQFQKSQELDELKNRFYTNITHEFRTPLTVILGMNEQLAGNHQAKTLIRRNANNLLRLISQLLDLSRLEAGTLKPKLMQSDIVAYCRYLTESFYSLAEEKKQRLVFFSEEESLVTDFDEQKIQYILFNLLSNAIKFTPEAGQIVVHLKKEDQEFLLTVKDNGPGIAADKLPHIFERFYQAEDSNTRSVEGSGIGLTFTKELVKLLGGSIHISSALGKGTSAGVLLPIKREAPLLIKPMESFLSAKEAPTDANSSSISDEGSIADVSDHNQEPERPTLLLVEDNADLIAYVINLLSDTYSLLVARNGEEGLDMAIEHVPDIIISDVMMPKMDGFELCDRLKKEVRTSHIPLILLTAKATQADKVQGLSQGADAYLAKPFDEQELRIRLRKLIDLRKSLQNHYKNYSKEDHRPQAGPQDNPLDTQWLQKARALVLANIDNTDLSIPALARKLTMSQTQLYRKLKALLAQTPSQFVRQIRLEEGKRLLAQPELTIAEIAYEVGFADPNYFSKTFNDAFGSSPSDFRKKL